LLISAARKKLFSFLLKALVLVLAFGFIYHQYLQKGDNLRRFQTLILSLNRGQVILIMALVVLLMLVNWTLESLKWRFLTRKLVKISVWEAIEAVFCGLTWAIFTPNRLGEYAGRVLFLPSRKRLYGVFSMAVGSFGQNVITNVLGLSALMWFYYKFYHFNPLIFTAILIGSVAFMAFILVFYFHIKWLVNLLNITPFIKKYHRFFDIMSRYKKKDLINIMGVSMARYAVFSFQYYLLIHLLIPEIPLYEILLLVFILLFIQSALPSLDLFDFGVRNATASVLFGYVTHQTLAVMAAVTSIWLINLIIPAILGSIFVFKLNFFDRNL
jgi:uncharacterized membrane protein YbhN (UPF0104 family)